MFDRPQIVNDQQLIPKPIKVMRYYPTRELPLHFIETVDLELTQRTFPRSLFTKILCNLHNPLKYEILIWGAVCHVRELEHMTTEGMLYPDTNSLNYVELARVLTIVNFVSQKTLSNENSPLSFITHLNLSPEMNSKVLYLLFSWNFWK